MEIVTKYVPNQYIQTEYGQLPVYEVLEILEELEGTSMYGQMLVLHDKPIEKWLESKGLIESNIRGAICEKRGSEGEREKLVKEIYKALEESEAK